MYVCRVGRLNIGQELIGFGLQGARNGTLDAGHSLQAEHEEGAGPGRARVAFDNSVMAHASRRHRLDSEGGFCSYG